MKMLPLTTDGLKKEKPILIVRTQRELYAVNLYEGLKLKLFTCHFFDFVKSEGY